jgi:hypothetical protein
MRETPKGFRARKPIGPEEALPELRIRPETKWPKPVRVLFIVGVSAVLWAAIIFVAAS